MNEDDNYTLQGLQNGCGFVCLFWAVVIALCYLLSGCKTVERENIVTKTDTVRIYSQHKDSVVYRDSVFVHLYERGDTIYHVTERWNVQYRDRIHTDTVYKVREEAQQSKEAVEKKEPWYDSFLTRVLLCLLAGIIFIGVVKLIETKVLH